MRFYFMHNLCLEFIRLYGLRKNSQMLWEILKRFLKQFIIEKLLDKNSLLSLAAVSLPKICLADTFQIPVLLRFNFPQQLVLLQQSYSLICLELNCYLLMYMMKHHDTVLRYYSYFILTRRGDFNAYHMPDLTDKTTKVIIYSLKKYT